MKSLNIVYLISSIFAALLAILFISSVRCGFPEDFFIRNKSIDTISVEGIINNCKNLSLTNSAKCVVDNFRVFYKYNISNQEVSTYEMDFDKLVREGGTCKHYAKYYEDIFSKLGFKTKHISLLPELKHGFSIIYNKTGYCIIDQKRFWCWRLK